jgi:NADPH:quinone reductase-like Zn-dependent oxidoreductase
LNIPFPKTTKCSFACTRQRSTGPLAAGGNFRPVIDRTYPLEKIAEAFDYVATGNKIGNVIITIDT